MVFYPIHWLALEERLISMMNCRYKCMVLEISKYLLSQRFFHIHASRKNQKRFRYIRITRVKGSKPIQQYCLLKCRTNVHFLSSKPYMPAKSSRWPVFTALAKTNNLTCKFECRVFCHRPNSFLFFVQRNGIPSENSPLLQNLCVADVLIGIVNY